MYLIDSHDAILHVENPYHLVLPKHQSPSPQQWFHIGCLKFAAERNIVPKGNAVPKQAHQEKPVPLCWRGTILRFNVYWICRACPGIPKEAPDAASALPRLGPFLFGPAIYPQRKLPVYKNEQRQRARYDRLSDGCRSRPTVSKRGRDKPDGLSAQSALGPFLCD